jgi:pimeloyl-ACP methyl ester carboxylesterase
MKRLIAMVVLLLIAAVQPAAADDNFFAYDLIFHDVEMRPGVNTDINVLVLKNKDPRSWFGKTIVALHGLANTASTWKPMAEELFAENPIGRRVRYILAINLPGRGYSGLPEGETDLLFGEMELEDHVQTVINTLERIRQAGFRPQTIMAHSQGGLIMQMVQQALIDDGSSLRSEFQIRKVFFMAAIGPKQVPWAFADSGIGAQAVNSYFIKSHDELGPHLGLSDMDWLGLFFAVNPGALPSDIKLAPNAPFAALATENYNSPEPIQASIQLVGLVTDGYEVERPKVDRGIFDKTGTKLAYVAMSLDGFQTTEEQMFLYEYLTNDSGMKRFAVVESDDAVHSMYISNPRELLESLVPSDIILP